MAVLGSAVSAQHLRKGSLARAVRVRAYPAVHTLAAVVVVVGGYTVGYCAHGHPQLVVVVAVGIAVDVVVGNLVVVVVVVVVVAVGTLLVAGLSVVGTIASVGIVVAVAVAGIVVVVVVVSCELDYRVDRIDPAFVVGVVGVVEG